METINLEIKKLIIGVSKLGTPYHSWRRVKTITRWGMYQVIDGSKENCFKGADIIWNKRVIPTFHEAIDIIGDLEKQKLRDWKIRKLID